MKDYSNSRNKESRTLPTNPKGSNQAHIQFQKDPLGWYKLKTDSNLRGEGPEYSILRDIKSGEEVMVVDKGDRLSRFKLSLLTREHSWVKAGDNYGWIKDDSLIPATAAYDRMTSNGLLWNHVWYEQNTKALGKIGKAYFEKLSKLNIDSLNYRKKHSGANSTAWFKTKVEEIETLLNNTVVNHYTNSVKAKAMLEVREMKSQNRLAIDNPEIPHNTQPFDEQGLANTDFLFFFIEPHDTQLRDTRFASGGGAPARISVPIRESGLLTHGWVMITDFAQREFPTVKATEDDSDFNSAIPSRLSRMASHYTKMIRSFAPGQFNPMEPFLLTPPNEESQNVFNFISQLVLSDRKSQQIYHIDHEKKIGIPEQLYNNILVGSDIIPGIANKAALEIYHINCINTVLGQSLIDLHGIPLIHRIFHDFFRPQAMIPNSMVIKREYVQPTEILEGD
ncbi:hypothetical protein [Bacteroides sp. 51]|uniref:hypothetical protein n=1 Tax=Bacteroides sp. 51 TaxID=2302938 RepID=UPI0013D851DE|nr:hypothetical protein [Bacteroides sp. 51]NDV83448.1 hypothetical protein [Bacteroides sp. 51]